MSSAERPHRSWLTTATLLVGLGTAFGFFAACSDEARPPGAEWQHDGGNGGSGGGIGPCTDGASEKCGIKLGEHEGVLSCYEGTRTCADGKWGACGDGTVVSRPAPDTGGNQPQALGPPTGCDNNPCDPYCQTYNESPDGAVAADSGGPLYNWPTGLITGYPAGLVSKGLKQPCSSGLDCQFNHYCENPITGNACEHSKCLTGGGLTSTCDPCVTEICAADPSCCKQPYVHSCVHHPCEVGAKLKTTCDSCVAQICAADPYCCDTGWDALCVMQINSVCGLSCPLDQPGNWSQSCVDKVDTLCAASCGPPGPVQCSHDLCTAGTPLSIGCHPCASKICLNDPYCCDVTWDASCIAQVGTECGETCPVNMQTPPPDDGTCRPWLPGQTDPTCPGIDLSAGVPCTGTIPVCNHGNTTAPAGIKIVHFPANSKQYPKCDPDQTHPQMYTCYTDQPIPPGECIGLTSCPQLIGNREVMVNPAGPEHIAECTCKDNWTLYSGGSCAPPSCASGYSKAVFKPLNLMFVVDKSGSMSGANWNGTTGALKKFFQDPGSAGLGVALEFFPLASGGSFGDGCPGTSCASTPCSNPMVTLGTLTTAAAPTDAQEQKLVSGISAVSPGGQTPTHPAVDGSLKWAIARTTSFPNQYHAIVLVSDGDPNECNTSNAQIAALAADAYSTSGVRTYAVGLDGASITALDQIAAAGGTGKAFVIIGNNANKIEEQMIAAFQSIAAANVSCSFDLPPTGQFDPLDVSVTFTASSGVTSILPQRTALSACGSGGWYYNNPTTPTQVVLCPETCTAAKTDAGSSVSVNVGCPKAFVPSVFTEPYEAVCPQGSAPIWGYFAYNSITPGDSSVVFRARTASTQAGLASATFKQLAVAKASPDTQVCPMSGPAPCPVDLYVKLGGIPDARHPFMEFEITLNPTSNKLSTPLINSWELSYSCPPSE